MNRFMVIILVVITLITGGVIAYRLISGQRSQAGLVTEQGNKKLTPHELEALENQMSMQQINQVAGRVQVNSNTVDQTLNQVNRINRLNQSQDK